MPSSPRSVEHKLLQCVNCCLFLRKNLRRHNVEELSEQVLTLLRAWIMPTPISPLSIICNECFVLLEERLSSNIYPQKVMPPAFGHNNVCFGCGISLTHRLTHKVPLDCPQRNNILRWIPAHQVERLDKVCRACWMVALREIKNPKLYFVDSKMITPTDVGDMVVEPPISEQQELPVVVVTKKERVQENKINSLKYRRVASTSRHCLFKGCENKERLLLPNCIKEFLLYKHKIYVGSNGRICKKHLHSDEWDELKAPYRDFNEFQVDDILSKLESAVQRKLDFNNLVSMNPLSYRRYFRCRRAKSL